MEGHLNSPGKAKSSLAGTQQEAPSLAQPLFVGCSQRLFQNTWLLLFLPAPHAYPISGEWPEWSFFNINLITSGTPRKQNPILLKNSNLHLSHLWILIPPLWSFCYLQWQGSVSHWRFQMQFAYNILPWPFLCLAPTHLCSQQPFIECFSVVPSDRLWGCGFRDCLSKSGMLPLNGDCPQLL